MAETELLPCPFCGGEAEYEGLYVYCTQCFVRAPDEPDEAEAVAAWNRRPPDVAELVEALKISANCLDDAADKFAEARLHAFSRTARTDANAARALLAKHAAKT